MRFRPRYSVFVGGVEVNDFELTKKQAKALLEYWLSEGYDDDAKIVRL